MRMTVFGGWLRETTIEAEIIDRGAGAGEIVCLECAAPDRIAARSMAASWRAAGAAFRVA
jgi:hypothetical protein